MTSEQHQWYWKGFNDAKAQPEQRSANEHLEPVACTSLCVECTKRGDWVCAKAIPPQRDSSATPLTWVGLTDEEMKKVWYAMQNIMGWYSFQEIAKAIEAKLKAKNERLEKNT